MNIEDVEKIIIQWVKDGAKTEYSNYGYDVYLPNVIRSLLAKEGIDAEREGQIRKRELSPYFYAAAWELCRRGIIRPGVKIMGEQATVDGSSGNGYSITPFGKQWIDEGNRDAFIPTEPGRFAEMLAPYKQRFGPGFYERAQEAIRCYGAHAYLACCVMCGAATESILLALAIEKKDDEQKVIIEYSSARGRSKIENIVVGQVKENIRNEFHGYLGLLKYWRDEAAHGKSSDISDNEAYTSLALLLRFAMFAQDNWKEFINSG
ncbi:MAG: hypothetical protein IPP66_05405 [Anaerolineales bacterium]|nr:hypothetical protein [Anaerolineales bacterium]